MICGINIASKSALAHYGIPGLIIEKHGRIVDPENIGVGDFDKQEVTLGSVSKGKFGYGSKLQGDGELGYLVLHVVDAGLHFSLEVVCATGVEDIGFAEVVVAYYFAIFIFEADVHGIRLER